MAAGRTRCRVRAAWAIVLAGVLPSCAVHAAGFEDARGARITLEAPASRIVSLAPHVTELLFAAGAGDRLIAADEYSNHPEAARRLPRIGNSSRLDLERVISLAPDLVIGWKSGNDAGDITRLERLGLRVYVTELEGLADIPDMIERFGALAGTSEIAAGAAAGLRARLDDLARRNAQREPVTVFYQIWERPLMTVNGRHFISDAIRLCGGVNVFEALEPVAPTVSIEAVIAADPRVIISSSSNEADGGEFHAWRRWRTIAAVRDGLLFTIPPDLIARPTARIVEGVEMLCSFLERARQD